MAEQSQWQQIFLRWPESIPRRGMVVTTLNETIPFKGFMTSDTQLLLDRTNPDALGARFILLEYPTVSLLKYSDPLKAANFAELGLVGKLSQ